MALKDCFRESARARARQHARDPAAPAAAALAGVATGPKPRPRPSSAAASAWSRMRASQDEADGASQHIDLTPKANQPQWRSSWRQGKVNGKPLAPDPAPAIDISDAEIEISDTRTGELLYSGTLPPRRGKTEEEQQLQAAIQASLESSASSVASGRARPVPAKGSGTEPTDAKAGAEVRTVGEVGDLDRAATEPPAEPLGSRTRPAAAAPVPVVRVPYRANVLTRVLRNCFEDDSHRTAIVAAVAPGAESVIHTLNTLDHVVLMAPHLLHHTCEVDVQMTGSSAVRHSYEDTPVHEWSAEQVSRLPWLASLPPDLPGFPLATLASYQRRALRMPATIIRLQPPRRSSSGWRRSRVAASLRWRCRRALRARTCCA